MEKFIILISALIVAILFLALIGLLIMYILIKSIEDVSNELREDYELTERETKNIKTSWRAALRETLHYTVR